ncbi:methyltransferase domain protein, partial [Vibrio parahaemolyticus EKP-008]
MIRMRT